MKRKYFSLIGMSSIFIGEILTFSLFIAMSLNVAIIAFVFIIIGIIFVFLHKS